MYIYGIIEDIPYEPNYPESTLFALENKNDVGVFIEKIKKYFKSLGRDNVVSGWAYENIRIISPEGSHINGKDNIIIKSFIRVELHEWSTCSDLSIYRNVSEIDYDICMFNLV